MFKLLLLAILLHFVIYLILAKKTIKVDYHKKCTIGQNVPMMFYNWSLHYTDTGGFTFSGIVEVYREIKHDKLETTFAIQRCSSKEALDTCEKLSTIKPPSICYALDLKGVGFDEFREGFEPHFHCPFKKGIYRAKNVTVNAEMFKLLPLEGYYWKLNASIYEDKIFVLSICLEFSVLNLRT